MTAPTVNRDAMKLDYTGMTPEQIKEFINSTSINQEVDGSVGIDPSADGELIESSMELTSYSGWLTGTVLGVEIQNNYGECAEDFIEYALEAFKESDFEIEKAQKILAKKVPFFAEDLI